MVILEHPRNRVRSKRKAARYVTLPALGYKKVPLGVYIRAVKMAKNNPEATFKQGLSCWWPCTGKEIMEQFFEGIQDRINQAIPYKERGII